MKWRIDYLFYLSLIKEWIGRLQNKISYMRSREKRNKKGKPFYYQSIPRHVTARQSRHRDVISWSLKLMALSGLLSLVPCRAVPAPWVKYLVWEPLGTAIYFHNLLYKGIKIQENTVNGQ